MRSRTSRRGWRAFRPDERAVIERQLGDGHAASCPCCGTTLSARRGTRLARLLPGNVSGNDLECHCCRRFHARVRHTRKSLRQLRLRRLVAAVMRA